MPCIVNTAQGINVLYNDKYLYSTYAPPKAILNQINNINITEGTLILVFSPVLPYGLFELSKKLAPNCYILGIETNKYLNNFIKEHSEDYINIPNYCFLEDEEPLNLPHFLHESQHTFLNGKKFLTAGSLKKVISINSSSMCLDKDVKKINDYILQYTNYSLIQFWKNRITLTKFGKRYCQHFFKNLHNVPYSTPIKNYFNTIEKPIFVLGSGTSLEQIIPYLKQNHQNLIILCVDTALQILLHNNIKVFGVFIEEAQSIILKSFIGTQQKIKEYNTKIFAALSSVPIRSFSLNQISYFTTEFTKTQFITDLDNKELLPPINNPFGSVGLTCFYYALKFRKTESVPIYVCGLDFAYPIDKTHAKGSLAHKNKLINKSRLKSIFSLESAINENTKKFILNNKPLYSSPILIDYATLFNSFFGTLHNCFSCTKDTFIKLPFKDCYNQNIQINDECDKTNEQHTTLVLPTEPVDNNQDKETAKYNDWFTNEKKELLELKDLLTKKTSFSKEKLQEKITKIIQNKEYLYLHFADGHKFEYTQSFLNRIRVQIDFFLKIM